MSTGEVTYFVAQYLGPSEDTGGQGQDFGKSSPVGLLLLVVFGIAVVLLVRSMTKHLKKLPVAFDQDKAAEAAPARVKRAEAERAAREAEEAEELAKAESGPPGDSAGDGPAKS
ncbi:hypothetical protein [Saccharopolyspora sp. CA-218241]|uniref:hypothetical protein n=1 Tax=Saccharopolyspora sp. CA-218241 TaxID=3240027 RepID=UPI003D97D7B7